MEWISYIVIGLLGFFAIKQLIPSPKLLGAATNALLAEHSLKLTELVPDNPFVKELSNAIINSWRLSGFPNITDEAAIDSFNSKSRFIQLNIIAIALHEIGHQPMLANEFWHPVRNPFEQGIDDLKHMQAVSKRLEANYGKKITIPERRFKITQWGLSDG